MHQCITGGATPQPPQFPKVSHRLMVRVNARRDAHRHGVPAGAALAAVDRAWTATGGDRYAARRAGWAATDALRAQRLSEIKA